MTTIQNRQTSDSLKNSINAPPFVPSEVLPVAICLPRSLSPQEIAIICLNAQQTVNLVVQPQEFLGRDLNALPWLPGTSIIPEESRNRSRKRYLRAKTGYQFFIEYFAKKYNGRLPPGGAWNHLPPQIKYHFNLLANRYNAFWGFSRDSKEDELVPLPCSQ